MTAFDRSAFILEFDEDFQVPELDPGRQLDLDAYAWHTFSVAWTSTEARFYVDDHVVRTVRQSVTSPQLLLVDLFEFPPGAQRDPLAYPKAGEVAAVRGYRHARPE